MAVKFLNGIEVEGTMNIVASDIPNLDAGKITSGTFSTSRIPNLSASKITSGTINASRLPDLSGTYQPKGSYLTSIPAEYLTQTEGDARYLTSLPSHNHDGDYLEYSYSDVNMDTYDSDRSLLLGRNIGGWSSGTKPSGAHNGFGILHVTTHEGGYATQFGFDTNQNKIWVRSKNPTSWGAWKYMWTEQDFSSTNVSNWNTAFGWGNHASAGYLKTLPTHSHSWASITGKPSTFAPSAHNHDSSYDAIGSADEVNVRIDNEIIPLIGTKADASHTHSYLPLSGGTLTGNVTFTGDNPQILFKESGANDAGGIRYTYGNNDGVFEFWTSDDYNEPFVWRSYDIGLDGTGNYQEWMKLVSKNLYVDGNLVHHRGNLNALTNATVSNDTITFTKSDGSTFSVTTSDANTNTWRPIDDTPVNGVTDQSISSNWAYDHANASNPHGITPANIGALASDAQAVDSDKLDGYHASTTRNAVNTIPVRDANGYLNLGWINTTSGNTTATITDFYVNTNDGYIRKATKAHVKSQLGLGSAAYVATSSFDAAGSAAAVDTRITEDIVPAIGAAQTTADNAATAAADALFDANKALQEVANIPTNNNQLTNGAGYLTATNDRVYITDSRGSARAPSYYNDRYAQWDFQNSADTGVGGDSWHGILTVSKWSSWNASHRQEQLIFSGDHLWRRTASSDSAWGDNKKIWDSGNLDAFVSASVSNDTITFTKANGGTVAVTTSDANTNTWRPVDDTPVDGRTTHSISSNWAFDNVKTAVPANAKFTDTNTQLTDAQVRSKFSAGTNVSISAAGVISATDTNTQLTDAQVRSKFSAGTNIAISATGVISSTDTNTWRPIDSTPTNGATGDSISSDWAYDNVRNFSSGGNSLAGSFTATGDITAFSDARVKENVETIHSALEKVTSMRGVTYNKIGDEKSSMGVIAQEIQEVAPEVVRENEDGMLSVAYGNITAVLIEAIKEQQKQIEELKSRLDGVTK